MRCAVAKLVLIAKLDEFSNDSTPRYAYRIIFAADLWKLEASTISDCSGSACNHQLPQRRMLIEVEGVFEVQRDELSEMYLIEAGKQIDLLGTLSSIL